MNEGMQEVLDIIQMVFDTIKKYILLILGRGDEIEDGAADQDNA